MKNIILYDCLECMIGHLHLPQAKIEKMGERRSLEVAMKEQSQSWSPEAGTAEGSTTSHKCGQQLIGVNS